MIQRPSQRWNRKIETNKLRTERHIETYIYTEKEKKETERDTH